MIDKKKVLTLCILTIILLISSCNSPAITPHDNDNLVAITKTIPAKDATPTSDLPISAQMSAQSVPVAIVSLNDGTIHFECMNTSNCIPDIKLHDLTLINKTYALGPVFYWDPSSVFIILYSNDSVQWQYTIIHVDSKTGIIKSIKIPYGFNNFNSIMVDNRLVLAEYNKKDLLVIDENLSIDNIAVTHAISSLVGTTNNNLIALDKAPIEANGDFYVELSVVDVRSKDVSYKRFGIPKLIPTNYNTTPEADKFYLISIEGISTDLGELYCLFFKGDTLHKPRVGKFSLETGKELISTVDQAPVLAATGYAQYHDMLYGPGGAPINMSTVTSIPIDTHQNPDLKLLKHTIPYDESFLIGTMLNIYTISAKGEILAKYPLPQKWINEDYQIMYYMN